MQLLKNYFYKVSEKHIRTINNIKMLNDVSETYVE